HPVLSDTGCSVFGCLTILWGRTDIAVIVCLRKGLPSMPTPLVPHRPAATGALTGAAVLLCGIVVAPSAALAQQEEVDLYEENAWVIDQVGAEAAWETTKGEGVTVAVIDTGIAKEHPFLEDKNILPGK